MGYRLAPCLAEALVVVVLMICFSSAKAISCKQAFEYLMPSHLAADQALAKDTVVSTKLNSKHFCGCIKEVASFVNATQLKAKQIRNMLAVSPPVSPPVTMGAFRPTSPGHSSGVGH